MKSGKVSDTTLRRSILKEVQKVNQRTLSPMVGGGAGSISVGSVSGGLARASMQTVCGEGLLTAYLAAVRAANSLAAKGAIPQSASIAITVPESMDDLSRQVAVESACNAIETPFSVTPSRFRE